MKNNIFIRLLLTLICFSSCFTTQAKDYSPSDVYAEALLLEGNIKKWQLKEGKSSVWVNVVVEKGYQPRHVFQKAVVIIEKINRYRVNVLKIGAIPTNYPGGRKITPNEVYNQVHRARQELSAMLENIDIFIDDSTIKQKITGKTPNDVYAKLKEISIALDGYLGLRGISPSDVYIASQQIVSIAKFLRISQNLPIILPAIKRTKNKRPNHALAAVKTLTIKIDAIEKNLAMDPVRVIDVPKRVISPSDVYNAMGIVFAELQRIQFNLGLERYFPQQPIQKDITSDDIIFNLKMAQELLPPFLDNGDLQYYDRSLLIKTPSDVFSLTHDILNKLYRFCRVKGIRIPPYVVPSVANLKPKHVYTQGLETLEMIVLFRENQGLGVSATAEYPLKEITPQEVFDLSLRIDEYLHMIFSESSMDSNTWITNEKIEYFYGKTPSDVYINMWKVSNVLKAILSKRGINSNHLIQKADHLVNKIEILNSHFSSIQEVTNNKKPKNNEGKNKQTKKVSNNELLIKVLDLKKLIVRIKAQQGIPTIARISSAKTNEVTISDIHSELWQLDLGIFDVGLSLGLDEQAVKALKAVKSHDGKLNQLYQKLLIAEQKLTTLSRYNLNVNDRKH